MKMETETPEGMTSTDQQAFREILGRPRKPIDRWFAENPKAYGFVQEYRRMKAVGETDWGYGRLHTFLVKEYGFPFSKPGIAIWLVAADREREE